MFDQALLQAVTFRLQSFSIWPRWDATIRVSNSDVRVVPMSQPQESMPNEAASGTILHALTHGQLRTARPSLSCDVSLFGRPDQEDAFTGRPLAHNGPNFPRNM